MLRLGVVTPIGPVILTEEDGAIVSVRWGEGGVDHSNLLDEAAAQIAAYFAADSTGFDLPLRVDGSGFQKDVCRVMQAIPFGETRTYGDIARDLGVSAQAVGQACGANPIPLLIPCHRVLGASSLGGFSAPGGVETKVWLLRHEGAAGLLI